MKNTESVLETEVKLQIAHKRRYIPLKRRQTTIQD